MRMKRISLLLPLVLPTVAAAGSITITDGQKHVVDSPVSAYYLIENGSLNVRQGAVVSGITLYDSSGHVHVSGGLIEPGINVEDGKLRVSGGTLIGTDGSAYGGTGAFVSNGTANISGGTFIGGNVYGSGGQPGDGVVGSAGTVSTPEPGGTWHVTPFLSVLNISGGTFVGGTGGAGYYGGTSGYSLESLGQTTVTGGNFYSPIAINTTSAGAYAEFLGSHLTYNAGILSGTLADGDPIHVQIFGTFGRVIVNPNGTEVTFASANAVPEPSSVLVFSALTGGLTLTLRRRSRANRNRS